MKTDYYELLQVSVTASNVELKKAYRKKALQLHPDKNPDDIENATRLFNDVRIAYETLVDPQERSWYDSHKFQILMENEDFDEGNDNDDNSQFYVAGVTVEDIQKYFNTNFYQKYDNSMHGFYAVVNVLLDKIASEEVLAGKQQKLPGFEKFKDDTMFATACDAKELMYPRFGNSNSDFGDQVRIFYKIWQNFQSVKTFTWLDEYRYVNAPDRRTRRLMEKENKKLRDQARRNYNEMVRKFIGFIKKLDPRMDPVARKRYEQEKLLKQRQEMKKQAQLEKEERKRQRQQYCDQEWQTADPDELAQIEEQLNKIYEEEKKLNGTESDDDDDINIYQCIVCNKTFKSEKQFQDHEKSKKHLKLLKQLKWEMKKEGIELGIDQENFIDEPLDGGEFDGDTDADLDLDEFDDALETLDELDTLGDNEDLLEKDLISDFGDLSEPEPEPSKINDEIDDDINEDEIFFAKQNNGRQSISLSETIRTTKESKQLKELLNLMSKSSLDSDMDESWATNKGKGKNKNKGRNKKKVKKPSVS